MAMSRSAVKLIMMFGVIKFFTDFLQEQFGTDTERA